MKGSHVVAYVSCLFSLLCANLAFSNSTYDRAYQLKSNGQYEEAIKGFVEAEKEAAAVDDSLTRFSALYCASYSAHRLSRNSDCLKFADAALEIAAECKSESWTRRVIQSQYEIELIGLMERSHYILAQLGAGWEMNRRGIRYLRDLHGLEGSGYLTPEEVLKFPSRMRSSGWRYIEREADYLYESGDAVAAKELLTAAVLAAEPDLRANTMQRSFYSLKLVGKLALIEGFLGNELRSIELHEQEYAYAEKWSTRRNLIRIRINQLAEIADYRGADEAIVADADALLKEFQESGYPGLGSIQRMHAEILAAQLSSEERLNILLEAASKGVEEESLVESFYASRNALFIRAGRNESNLDDAFMKFLQQSRSQGNLRAEPRIYRKYGDWLRQQKRCSEAIHMYRVCLDRVLVSEWHAQVVLLYGKLAAAYLDAGQSELAFVMIQELERYLALHDTIPPHQVLAALDEWVIALLSHGEFDQARLVAEQWHSYGLRHQVPDRHMHAFSDAFVEAYILQNDVTHEHHEASGLGVFVHPVSITTVAVPEQASCVAFFVMNSGASSESGVLKVSGNGVSHVMSQDDAAGGIYLKQVPSDALSTLAIPLSLDGGTLRKVYIERAIAAQENQVDDGAILLEWAGADQSDSVTAVWHCSVGGTTETAAVIDAAEIRPNSFVGVPVEHTVYFPDSFMQSGVPIRIRSQQAFRIEYRDPDSGAVLAVDNNGNGDFSERGDFWKQGIHSDMSVAAPMILRTGNQHFASVEVWYFPSHDAPFDGLEVTVEVFVDGGWHVQAIDLVALPEVE